MTDHEHVVARPGDTLIVRLRADVSRDTFDEAVRVITAEFAERLPGIQVLVLGGAEQLLVYRPDEPKPDEPTDWMKHVRVPDELLNRRPVGGP